MEQQRHLAAILFTDIVGYTAMMQENESKAVAVVKKYHSILQNVVTNHSGKIINDYGDGSLCTFSSTIDAIHAALEIQENLKKEQIPLRIGLHVGEILFEDGKVFGDGVNIASRIQSLGQANTILFSGEINSKIRNQPEFNSVSLGKFEFKNVDEPIEVFALSNQGLIVPKKEELKGKLKEGRKKLSEKRLIPVSIVALLLIATIFFYIKNKNSSKFTGKEKSIAVLPFVNMSTDKENEYFSDGMTEEITTQLSKIAELKVIARTSAMLFKNSKKSVKEIAEELGVSAILEGSVQKAGNSIKITAQLIDANTQKHIWADTYDREFKDVFSIQSEVAQAIAFQLNAKLTTEEKKKIEKAPTSNPEAYKYYLQGTIVHWKFFETLQLEYYTTSKTLFEMALGLDSNYAFAHAALAYLYDTYRNYVKNDSALLSLQIKETEKAYLLDSTLSYINYAKGQLFMKFGNYEEAFRSYKKALEINPKDPTNLMGMSVLLNAVGLNDEAVFLMSKAIELDPLTAGNYETLANFEAGLDRLDEAKKNYKTALQLEPDYYRAMDGLILIYSAQDKLDSATKLLEKRSKLRSVEEAPSLRIAFYYAKQGNKNKALELASKNWVVLLTIGRNDDAIKAMPFYIETGKEKGTPYLFFKSLLEAKKIESIKNNPDFLRIMERSRLKYEENKKKYSIRYLLK
jgi:TolB-like protein/class 3 adenylate cyclase/Flp pilus assembly protein TadD